MEVLLLRLALTPSTVLLASVVQRRWGHALGGRLIGLPLTTGPFLVLVALAHGASATAVAATGVVAGQIAVVTFCVAYARLCLRRRPMRALAGSWVLAAGSVLAMRLVPAPWPAATVVVAAVIVGRRMCPQPADGRVHPVALQVWQTPVRMVLSGALVAVLAGATRVVGPYLAGVLATTPVILSVLAPTTHRGDGPAAAAVMLRGTLAAIPGTVLFAAVVSSAAQSLGVAWAFVAGAAALVVSTLALSNVFEARAVDTIEVPTPAR